MSNRVYILNCQLCEHGQQFNIHGQPDFERFVRHLIRVHGLSPRARVSKQVINFADGRGFSATTRNWVEAGRLIATEYIEVKHDGCRSEETQSV